MEMAVSANELVIRQPAAVEPVQFAMMVAVPLVTASTCAGAASSVLGMMTVAMLESEMVYSTSECSRASRYVSPLALENVAQDTIQCRPSLLVRSRGR